MLTRRKFLTLGSGFLAAPAIVRAASLDYVPRALRYFKIRKHSGPPIVTIYNPSDFNCWIRDAYRSDGNVFLYRDKDLTAAQRADGSEVVFMADAEL